MQEIVQNTIASDSVVVDTLSSVQEALVGLPVRDSNCVSEMSQIFGPLATKGGCFVDSISYMPEESLSWGSVILFLVILIPYTWIIKRYPKEITSIFRIIIFPALFNRAHEVSSVHLRHYLTYAFIFSVVVITVLSWIYLADGRLIVPILTYLYFVFKGGIPKLVAMKQGRDTPISHLIYFLISFHTTTLLALSPIALVSIVFGANELLRALIIIVLSSYYIFLARYFYKEKFSFKQLMLYLCTAEVIPLVLVSSLFYTKIIAFGN